MKLRDARIRQEIEDAKEKRKEMSGYDSFILPLKYCSADNVFQDTTAADRLGIRRRGSSP